MGLYDNPLSGAGYPPNVTGTPSTVPTAVRAATLAEANAGVLNNVYISPLTLGGSVAVDFANPPAAGFGSSTARPVFSTTLTSSGNTTLATGAGVTTISVANVAPSGARTSTYNGGNIAQNDTVNWFPGAESAGTQSFNIFSGINTGGAQAISFLGANNTGGTQSFSVLAGTRAGTINLGTGNAAHVLNFGGALANVGFFGKTAAVQQLQGAITNSVTAGGTTGTIADITDITTYSNAGAGAAIRNDIYQLALGLQGCIAALRTYGLLA